MAKETEKIKARNTATRGGLSCKWGITVHRESHLQEAICEKCDKVFKTDKNEYICPECRENDENSG